MSEKDEFIAVSSHITKGEFVPIAIHLSAETVRAACRHCRAMREQGASEEEIKASHEAGLKKLFEEGDVYYCDTDRADSNKEEPS